MGSNSSKNANVDATEKKKESKTKGDKETNIFNETNSQQPSKPTNDETLSKRQLVQPKVVYENTLTRTNSISKSVKVFNVLAVMDIGPFYTGCAFTFGKDYATQGQGLLYSDWIDKESGTMKPITPTTILFDVKKTAHSIGYDAEYFYNSKLDKEAKDKWYLFKQFLKDIYVLEYFMDMEISDYKNKNRTMKIIDVIPEYFRLIVSKVQEMVSEKTKVFTNKDIHWLLPVPAHWADKQCLLLQNALEKISVTKAAQTCIKEHESTMLYFETVSHAPYLYNELQIPKLDNSCRSIVLTFEGNILKVNVIKVHSKNNVRLLRSYVKDIPEIFQEFYSFLSRLFGGDVITRVKETYPSQYRELVNDFQRKFNSFRPLNDQRVLIRVPPAWFEILREITDDELQHIVDESSFSRDLKISMDKIVVSSGLFKSFCQDSLEHSIKIIEQILARESAEGIGTLFIIGESTYEVFIDSLKHRLPDHTIISSTEPGLVNLKGSILYGIKRQYN